MSLFNGRWHSWVEAPLWVDVDAPPWANMAPHAVGQCGLSQS